MGTDKSLFVFVGDISADKHTSKVLKKLQALSPEVKVWGVGGPEMKEAGFEALRDCQEFATFGIVEVLRVLPALSKLRAQLLEEIEKRKPQAVMLVDFGGFNSILAKTIRRRFSHKELPIVYFISPQVWASRPWRIKTFARTVNKMLVIFPFERKLYADRGVEARFVGNPNTSSLPSKTDLIDRPTFCQKHKLDENKPLVAIFPGSRAQEVRDHMPVILQAVDWMQKERPEVQFAISKANPLLAGMIDKAIDKLGFRYLLEKNLILVEPGENYELMANCDLAWAKSGSTTLEAAVMGTPMLIFYRANWLSALLIFCFKQIKRVGWPNILAGDAVVPELFQLDCRAELLVRYTRDWLDVPAFRQETEARLKKVRELLGEGDFAENVATELLKTLGQAC